MFSVRTGLLAAGRRAQTPATFGVEAPAGRVRRAAARVLPVAGHARERVEHPQRDAAAGVALHAHACSGCRSGRVVASRSPSATIRSSGRPVIARHAVGRELQDALAGTRPSRRVCALDVLAVLGAHVDDHVQQPERERGVGAGQRREVLVGLRSAVRVRSGSIATTCAPSLARRRG